MNTPDTKKYKQCSGAHCRCMNLDKQCQNFHHGDHSCPYENKQPIVNQPEKDCKCECHNELSKMKKCSMCEEHHLEADWMDKERKEFWRSYAPDFKQNQEILFENVTNYWLSRMAEKIEAARNEKQSIDVSYGFDAGIRQGRQEERDNIIKNIGMLRQWLNEDRITEVNRMITNEQIKDWLYPQLS